ncbi:META domain-containing protein [Helicobacter sp. MIT 14-3879]|uniref:META domain-containing protein n=1 Tax=Helicobacter sp. MIT 14-3879 TaxID=2040649 RepID=UPI000E1EED1F|nr:META domain-containing protein [Helicobacter sp. MIT 14-3879]RDU64679.1 hypothetical protein CQA44_02905 [Helicobacter sp. MIT 14-3879]
MKKILKIILLLAIGIFVVGCAGSGNISNIVESKLYKIKYISQNGETIIAPLNENVATLGFENDRIYGNAGCNRYFAGISWRDSNSIDISQAGSTKMMCSDDEANNFEYKYLKNLDGNFIITNNGNEILLSKENFIIALDINTQDKNTINDMDEEENIEE